MKPERLVPLIGGVMVLTATIFTLILNFGSGVCVFEEFCSYVVVIMAGLVTGFGLIAWGLAE